MPAPRWTRQLVALAIATALSGIFALPFAWASRYDMNPDGISYIDIARQVTIHSNWGALLNVYWSPVYPALIALMWHILKPSPAYEFPAIHMLNWLIFLFCALTFGWFLVELEKSQPSSPVSGTPDGARAGIQVSNRGFIVFGYAVLFWSTVRFVPLSLVTPDLLLTAILFGVAAICARIVRQPENTILYVALGGWLAIAYMVKSALFPLSLGLLMIMFFWARGWKDWGKRSLFALLAFLFFSLPLVLGLSRKAGQLTIGEAGRLNYLWRIDGLQPLVGWAEGEWHPSSPPESITGRLVHPLSVLTSRPLTVAFGKDMPGTYPIWFDPWHWYQGLVPHFNLHRQISVLWNQVRLLKNLVTIFAALLVGIAVLVLPIRRFWQLISSSSSGWATCWSLLSLALFSLVSLDWRYVAGFLVIAIVALYWDLAHFDSPFRADVVLGVTVVLFLQIATDLIGACALDIEDLKHPAVPGYVSFAGELRRSGLRAGDPVALVGSGVRAYFAHLADLRIIAEIKEPDVFQALSPYAREDLVRELKAIGVRALIKPGPACMETAVPNNEPGCQIIPLTADVKQSPE
ncbi:MAG: hypothetical protein JO210_14925 [Acidobacteriaceae bacterium]|nr:hypothetical protein [Acidobacteriaceae bacterium]